MVHCIARAAIASIEDYYPPVYLNRSPDVINYWIPTLVNLLEEYDRWKDYLAF